MPQILGTSKSIYGFDPRSIPGCCLWLDAADSDTVTRNLASVVSQWRDKTIHSNHATQPNPRTAGWIPNAIGGLPAIYMPNGGRFLGTFSSYIDSILTPGLSVFAVAYSLNTAIGHDQRLVSITRDASGSYLDYDSPFGIMPFDIQNSNLTTFYNYPTNGPNLTNNALGSNQVFAASMVATNTKIDAWFNGTPFTTTGGVITSLALFSSAYGIGGDAWTSGTEPWYGYIGEVLIYSNALSSVQRQAVEGYLTKKWGIAVPTTHPSYRIPPSTRYFNPVDIPGCHLWLDGKDARTFTFSSGTNISSWADKSGKGNNANILSTIPPTYSSTSNAVVFTASNSTGLRGNMSDYISSASVFIVTSYISNSGTPIYSPRLFMLGSNQPSENFLIGQVNLMDQGQTAIVNYVGNGEGGALGNANYQTAAIIPFSTPIIYTNISTYTGSTFKLRTTYNATTQVYSSKTGNFPVTPPYYVGAANRYAIGNAMYVDGIPNGDSYNGNVYEVIVYNTTLTPGQREQVEGYLSWKWNIRLNPATPLPSFYTFPPAAPLPFSPTSIPGCILWLDASDPSTTVNSITDKSGSGGSSTLSTGTRTLSNINGVQALAFNGSGNTGYIRGGWPTSYGCNLTTFAVATYTGTGPIGLFSIGNLSGTPNQILGTNIYIGFPASTNDAIMYNNNTYVYLPNTFRAPATNLMLQFALSGIPATSGAPFLQVNRNTYISNYIAGTAVGQGGSNVCFTELIYNGRALSNTPNGGTAAPEATGLTYGWGTFYPLTMNTWILGGGIYDNFSNPAPWVGCIGEVIVFQYALGDSERQHVEGYLAWKWGIQNRLPATHPYYKFAPGISPPATITTLGLAYHLDAGNTMSYSGSGSAWNDLTGTGLPCGLYGGATYSPDVGGCITFNPALNQYGSTISEFQTAAYSNWTIEVWMSPSNTYTGTNPAIVTQKYPSTINYVMGVTAGATAPNVGVGFFNGNWYYIPTGYAPTANVWAQFTGTYDGTALRLFVNSTQVQSQATTAPATWANNGGIILMKRWDNPDYFGGRLAIVRIYSRALSPGDISRNFNVQRARFGI